MANLPIPQDVFDRLTLVRQFDNNQTEANDTFDLLSLVNNYDSRVLTAFNLSWYLPADHLATQLYREAITVPANRIPYFTAPRLGENFPVGDQNYIDQPRNTSLLPILIAAQAARVDFRQYDIVVREIPCEKSP
jgi:hypothetical protein